MSRDNQKKRRMLLGAEFLEGRELLNAHIPAPHVMAAQVAAHSIHAERTTAARLITGTLTGQASYNGSQTNSTTYVGVDTYNVSGSTNLGGLTVTGADTATSLQKNSTTFNDYYYGGSWNLKLDNGSTVAIAYIGNGQSSASSTGPYTATFKGRAIGTSGSLLGHIYTFTAKVVGSQGDSSVSIKFSLKG